MGGIGILVCGMMELSGDLSGLPLIWWKCKQCYEKSQMEKALKAFWGMMETKQQIKTKRFFFRELHMETSGEAGNSLTRNKDFSQVWVLVLSLILTYPEIIGRSLNLWQLTGLTVLFCGILWFNPGTSAVTAGASWHWERVRARSPLTTPNFFCFVFCFASWEIFSTLIHDIFVHVNLWHAF